MYYYIYADLDVHAGMKITGHFPYTSAQWLTTYLLARPYGLP